MKYKSIKTLIIEGGYYETNNSKKNIPVNNNELADENRKLLNEKQIFTINLLGSPGSGKTCLLEKLIENIKKHYNMAVIQGDLYTAKDAMRIEKHNIDVIQLNTGGLCYLDASMISTSLDNLDINKLDFLAIENIGNLVFPAEYDLSEDMKIVVMSITEGNDKPFKYPLMFKSASVVILNKLDIIDHTNFDINEFYRDIRMLNKNIKVFEVSCKDNRGIEELSDFLKNKIREKKIMNS
nr:hydrogenase nickel incorporation protein HypB [uncultured Romboutsia sp.]